MIHTLTTYESTTTDPYENLAVELVSVADTLNTCDQADEDV